MMSRARGWIAAAACVAMMAWGSATAAAKVEGGALSRWPSGPVRYLLTRADEEEFGKLADDRARALFIVRFWQRWDPTPGTLENEVRREFWGRAVEANRRFKDSARPGWKTDRGKIFILLGEPYDVTVDEMTGLHSTPGRGDYHGDGQPSYGKEGSQGTSGETTSRVVEDTAERGLLRWTYRNLPGTDTDPEFVVAFVRDPSGEWRVSRNPRYYGPAFPELRDSFKMQDPTASSPLVASQSVVQKSVVSAASLLAANQAMIAMDLAESQRVPSPAELGVATVTATEFVDRFDVTPQIAFFKAADGNTQVRIGASVPAKEIYGSETPVEELVSFFLVYTRFSSPSGGPQFFASNESSPAQVVRTDISRPDAMLEAWTALTVPPGSYEAAIGVQDAATGLASSLRRTIDVPDLGADSPQVSTILPVYRLDEVGGRVVPTPRVASVFRREEDFGVYFEIYNLAQREGKASFDLTYRFYQVEGEELRPIGVPAVFKGLTEPVQGWSFPLEKSPPGSYSLHVVVDDGVAGQEGSASLDFEVR